MHPGTLLTTDRGRGKREWWLQGTNTWGLKNVAAKCKLCTCSSSSAALQYHLHCECAGVGAARTAGVAGPLADALYISARILRERDLEHEHLTALTAVWGQLVSHDIAYTLPISGDTSDR